MKKTKIIDIKQEHSVICDNPNCNYKIKNQFENIKQYINMPCPECGMNLLTEKDYTDSLKMLNIINWINKWFSWITIFYFKPKNINKHIINVHAHNGINIKIKKSKKQI